MWRIGVDVGGTFTDLFAWEEGTGKYATAKVLTTKHDRSIGVLEAVRKSGVAFSDISHFMHGTTTATNALIERNYPDAALITTEGFRDVIEIGRQHRKNLYDPYQEKPKPLIRRRNRFTVGGRMSSKGEERRPLDVAAAIEVSKEIAKRGINSVGIGFINSYVNPAHEEQMRDIVQEHNPGAYVTISADTRPVFREHARFVTTAIRACMMPVMTAYFDRLSQGLKEHGFTGSLLILKSNGGVMGADLAKNRPEELIESGPAGGIAYASYLSRTTGIQNLIHTDVGGTSFDTSIVEGGVGLITRTYELEWEIPVSVPMLDIHSVGAGGGSIGWVDEGSSLRVGPLSAGSEPGPACYGHGGTNATITDANLVLGRLHPSLSDKFTLDKAAAEKAIQKLADKIGLSLLETAEGMIRISCETMAQAVKGVLVARARDPRDYTLVSFGGAGPMHACLVAQALSIPKVLVPAQAGVASAFGATAMDVRHDLEAFYYTPLKNADVATLTEKFDALTEDGARLLAKDGIAKSEISFKRSMQMRYVGQTYEVEVDMPEGPINASTMSKIASAFHDAHQREYGVSSEEFEAELVSLGIAAVGKLPAAPAFDFVSESLGNELIETRKVYFEGEWHDANVIDGLNLPAGKSISGPAIVEYRDTCAILLPDCTAKMDTARNLIISLSVN